MTRKEKCQTLSEEDNPLEYLLERASELSNGTIASWEQLAAVLSYKSGQSVSGQKFRRAAKRSWEGWMRLTLSISQLDALCELTGMEFADLPRFSPKLKTHHQVNGSESN